MDILVAKLNNKIVQIVKTAETVQFSKDKNWILINSEPNKMNSLSVKWVRAKDTRFDWVKKFSFKD